MISRATFTRYGSRLLQATVGVIALIFAARALRKQWSESTIDFGRLHPNWLLIALSGVLFVITYAVLIEMWREVLRGWGARLKFWSAARIWTISNLGRYVPGKVVQIGAMGVMSEQAGVSPIAATGSSILNVVLNLIAGFIVVAVFGWPLLKLHAIGGTRTAILFLVVCVAALIVLPIVLPPIIRLISRITGRSFTIGALPRAAILTSLIGNVVAWLLYGAAFALFARGMLGFSQGPLTAYVAVYALSYLVGYLVLFAPAGAGFREAAMIALLPAAHLADPAQATILALTSRLWLTALEIAPGALFLGIDGLRRRPREE